MWTPLQLKNTKKHLLLIQFTRTYFFNGKGIIAFKCNSKYNLIIKLPEQ